MTRNRPSDAADIRHGDALDVLRGLLDASVDAVITDPPYGLSQEPDMIEVLRHWLAGDDYTHRGSGFMGRTWDSFVPGPAVWREAYRVLKPGGHLLCFAGTRTADLMGTAIRIAGFEVRDRIRVETTGAILPAELAWEYGSGFPKSHNLDGGLGTALKPAYEPIIVARKPLAGTVAANVLTYGTGALNIDACRVGTGQADESDDPRGLRRTQVGTTRAWEGGAFSGDRVNGGAAGRWPSNVVLVHGEGCVPVGTRKVRAGVAVNRNRTGMVPRTVYGDAAVPTEDAGYADEDGTETVEAWECVEGCPVAELDAQSGNVGSFLPPGRDYRAGENQAVYAQSTPHRTFSYGDAGGASRFFPIFRYQAKADGSERPSYIGPVCFSDGDCSQITDDMHPSVWPEWARDPMGVCPECGTPCGPIMHPTVKPLDLARWLIRLVVAKGGTFIDPFVGSGTFAEAAILEGVNAVVVDKVGAHIPLIEQRVRKYDNPHAMAATRRGEKVATRAKARNVTPDDEDDLFAGWAS